VASDSALGLPNDRTTQRCGTGESFGPVGASFSSCDGQGQSGSKNCRRAPKFTLRAELSDERKLYRKDARLAALAELTQGAGGIANFNNRTRSTADFNALVG